MKKRLLIFLPVIFISTLTIFAFTHTDGALDTLLLRLNRLTNDAPQEKVHLQFDKPIYSLGEDIWFKAYVVDAKQNYLSDQSKILYVDLLDNRDSVKQSLLLPMENGTANGHMHLSDSLLTA